MKKPQCAAMSEQKRCPQMNGTVTRSWQCGREQGHTGECGVPDNGVRLVEQALSMMDEANRLLDGACRHLSSVVGAQAHWRACARASDAVKAAHRELAYTETVWRSDWERKR